MTELRRLTPDEFAELLLNEGPFSREELLEKTEWQRMDYFVFARAALDREPDLLRDPKRKEDMRWYVEHAIWDDPPVVM
jgi:hypothetical protein